MRVAGTAIIGADIDVGQASSKKARNAAAYRVRIEQQREPQAPPVIRDHASRGVVIWLPVALTPGLNFTARQCFDRAAVERLAGKAMRGAQPRFGHARI